MNNQQIENLKESIASYVETLRPSEVAKEFIYKGLTNVNFKTSKGLESKELLNRVNEYYKGNYEAIKIIGLELIPSDYMSKAKYKDKEGLTRSFKKLCVQDKTCKKTCIAFSGQAKLTNVDTKKELTNTTILKRVRRTFLYNTDKELFLDILKGELIEESRKAKLSNTKLFVRLNVFSDIDYRELISSLPEISFYDYTKVLTRKPSENYKLIYSAYEELTKVDLLGLLNSGKNLAVVFEESLPSTFLGFNVVNGDLSDLNFLHSNSVVGLKLKKTIGKKEVHSSSFTSFSSLVSTL